MKSQIISLSAILASASFIHAGTDASTQDHREVTTQANSENMDSVMDSSAVDESYVDEGYGRNDRDLGTLSNDQDLDSRDETAASDEYFELANRNDHRVEEAYAKNHRKVAENIDQTSYEDRTQMRDDIREHVYYSDLERKATAKQYKQSEDYDKAVHSREEAHVNTWRNKLRSDLEKLDRTSEAEYEQARQDVRKSFKGYSAADTQAQDQFQTGSQRAQNFNY